MTLVASAAEDDFRDRGSLLRIFQLGYHPGEAPRRQEPSRTFFEVAGVDRNKQVDANAGCGQNICGAMASVKLAL
jgi:hypothetical protein